jgi:ribonuclease T
VDVETAGPSPTHHAMLSLGACHVDDPEQAFYVELVPDRAGVDPEALAVSGLSLERLRQVGSPPDVGLGAFAGWVDETTAGTRPVLVALNAPFDWMFVADALHRHVGRNPFGHSALDLKALYMGVAGVPWADTSLDAMAARYDLAADLPHHALEDARIQATVCRALFAELGRRRSGAAPRP